VAAHAPGWFGKIAPLGDFASRRLPGEWVQSVDGWLSQCMQRSQAALGERWLPAYLGAPVWRFAWGPGVVDGQWWFGVLMPSCDKVGRYFPLVVAQTRAATPVDRIGLDHLDLWWSRLARTVLDTLEESATLDAFESALHELPPWPSARAGVALQGTVTELGERYAVPPGATLSEVAHGIASAGLQQRLAGHGFWWPWRALAADAERDHGDRCLLIPGLPSPAGFVHLLEGG
jgi:type VI secretion system protein ImpM